MVNFAVKCKAKEPKTDGYIQSYDYSVMLNGEDISGNIVSPSDGSPAIVIEIPGAGAPPRVTLTMDVDKLDIGEPGYNINLDLKLGECAAADVINLASAT